MKVAVDRDRCGGHGRCVVAAPELFDLDDEGTSVVLRPEVAPDEEGAAREAASSCPTSAIRVE